MAKNGDKYAPLVAESLETHNANHGHHRIHHSAEADDLQKRIDDLERKRIAASERLEDFDRKWTYRRKFLAQQLQEVNQQKATAELALDTLSHPGSDHPPPPGPRCLLWVEGNIFQTICTVVIILNIIVMFLEMSHEQHSFIYPVLDNVFLLWYLMELTLKATLLHKTLLIGQIRYVWFNWLDLSIVLCGIAEQWLMPLIEAHGGTHTEQGVSPTYFRMLRLLRLVRVARIAKAIYVFAKLDLSWVEGHFFQSLMMGVIGANSIVMGMEVDYGWMGWFWVEQIFLVIYTFELTVRFKSMGLRFFGGSFSNAGFNIMDMVIVVGGMLDQWLLPLVGLVQKLALGMHSQGKNQDGVFFKLLRMMRLLRALRLIRLLRSIKPLFDLMTGIVEATQGVGWVLLLTMVILYAFAVTFTNLIGHGLIYDGANVPDEAKEAFGSVLTSMFNLFKLMNGDQDVVEPILNSNFVKLAFTGFMIIANWMVLAVLTSVVSDRMISTTQRHEVEEKTKEEKAAYSHAVSRLRSCLAEAGSYGTITWAEFDRMMQNDILLHEMCDASGLNPTDLEELFHFTAREDRVDVEEYLVKLLEHSRNTTERSMFRLERYIHSVETRMETRLEKMLEVMGVDKPEMLHTPSDDPHRTIFKKITKRRLDERCSGKHLCESQSIWL